ncbi:hypothetical protein K505DRAFT_377980 [Melanomma pulvis-pyrius CBS 109.77]|uniref:Uncharacterized protein n=1 Tax=Melanomma pulvis-pyrius CBS 109.77 TaxID=1314802 RepID=A0A6A6X0C0_9PLEO|nr:hypothetical protein K505DRAFT_377980 [Melanomma pulvis-pyrius CBS 109.77]
MNANSGSSKGPNKRTADNIEGDDVPQKAIAVAIPQNPSLPRILHRHQHRTRPIAGPANLIFNVYKAIIRHTNLFFQFAIRLEPQAMDDLLAIDKEFHYRFNIYNTSIITDYAKYHAPDAAYVFSPQVYPEMTISDPMLRPMDGRSWLARDIPSIRWTKMVFYRDGVVREILTRLALEGHRFPKRMNRVLMLFWIVMDKNTTSWRKAFLRDKEIWSDNDLILFHMFLVKLDMRFSDPILGNGVCELSHLFLLQSSLTMLNEVLSGRLDLSYDNITDLMIRSYRQEDLDIEAHPWMDNDLENGVPEEHWGLMSQEEWGMWKPRMEPALDMLILETARRGLHPQKHLLDFVTYGFVHEETGQNLPAPMKWRGERDVVLPREAWPMEEVRTGVIVKLDKLWGVQGEKKEADATREDIEMVDRDEALPAGMMMTE